MDNSGEQNPRFDLTPHPRILAMLGEIVLPQWRCIAELVDNSVDAFLSIQRSGASSEQPTVAVHVPTSSAVNGTVIVRDNGLGMDAATLERAARAGWTSHDPINNLGLFGMGFNIATARLGGRTTVWTTRSGDAEWVGMEIDFERLVREESFVTPALTRPKQDPSASGTEVEVGRLKPDQRDWFSRSHNRSALTRHLSRTYSAMLADPGVPISFRLEINGRRVPPKRHCIWGGPGNTERVVDTARHGPIDAFQPFDFPLAQRPFCQQCWNWLSTGDTRCPSCGDAGDVIVRSRRVHGWLGIQRYLHRSDFGVDFLRNGRKIEVNNKELFTWYDEATDTDTVEYPIDDPRGRGRIVGEVHLDHCRVPYTKDRFVREDASWQEMVSLLRGRGPLRPDIAAKLGSPENTSPLYRLFQAFRRSSPHNKRMAGAWSKILVVPDNDRATDMVSRFDGGDSDYQTDAKWWDLIEEADRALLTGTSPPESAPGDAPSPDGLGDGDDAFGDDGQSGGEGQPEGTTITSSPPRTRLAQLSNIYIDELTGQRYEVEAFAATANDPVLDEETPWKLRRTTSGAWHYFVNERHTIFDSFTMGLQDALLNELAWVIMDFERGQGSSYSYGAVLASLRHKYASTSRIDLNTLRSDAQACLSQIAQALPGQLSREDSQSLFAELSSGRQDAIQMAMASRGVQSPQAAIEDGSFLQYASPRIIVDFVGDHPEFFFDGKFWDKPYESLSFDHAAAREEAQSRTLHQVLALLSDAMWLAESDPAELRHSTKERLLRAALSIDLLAPTADREELLEQA